jgi:hypothetical protein
VKQKRVLLSLLVAVVLVLAIALPASAASQFTDIADSPYKAAIESLASMGVVGGYDDGTFRPDNPLMRQQFAKMAVLGMGYPVSAEDVSTFTDTPEPSPTNPLYPGSYVAVAAENSIIAGYSDNTFRFYNDVTRQQAITIIVRAAGSALADPPPGYQGVLDYSDPDHGQNIRKAEYNGLLEGIVDLASWDTTGNATRGETAQLVSQLLTKAFALRVTGPSGTELFTMSEVQALESAQGFGGTKNKVGTIVGPNLYQGVAVLDLLGVVGGIPAGSGLKVVASDGYVASFNYEQVHDGGFAMFDPATGDPTTTITGALQMIVAYAKDGSPIAAGDGPLRIAIVSPEADQVTGSGSWAKMVARLEVTAPTMPTVTAIDPSTGPSAGGNTVTITGTGFSGVTEVSFGGADLSSGFTVNSATQITVAAAPAGTDIVDITVTTPGGTSAVSAADTYTYYSLQVVNGDGARTYTLSALKALASVQGFGGTKNKAGVVAGPNQYQGVAVLGLLSEIAPLPADKGIKVTASDGYETSFTHEQVADGVFNMYDPVTGNPITAITGALQMVLAYAKDGSPLAASDGPLRIALLSPAAQQVTDGGRWSKAVVKIEVI